MGSFSNFAEDAFLNHITTNAPYTPAATIYLALATADPTDAATGAAMNEVANANGYARTAITFAAAAGRAVAQNANVVYPVATGPWGTVTHWAIVDSPTHGAGNVLAHGIFTTSFAVVAGNVRTIASGEAVISFNASAGGVGWTTFAVHGFLNRMFRNQVFTVSNTFISLHTATSSDATPGTEVAGGSYARVEVNEVGGADPNWEAVAGAATQNNDDVVFPDPTASWGTVVSMGIYDASVAGNQLAYGNDVVDQLVGTETTAILFQAGAIDLSLVT